MKLQLYRVSDPDYLAVRVVTSRGVGRLLLCRFDVTVEEIAVKALREELEIERMASGFTRENNFRKSHVRYAPARGADFVVSTNGGTSCVAHVAIDIRGIDWSFVRLLVEDLERPACVYLVTSADVAHRVPQGLVTVGDNDVAVRCFSVDRHPLWTSFDALAVEIWDTLVGPSLALRSPLEVPNRPLSFRR